MPIDIHAVGLLRMDLNEFDNGIAHERDVCELIV